VDTVTITTITTITTVTTTTATTAIRYGEVVGGGWLQWPFMPGHEKHHRHLLENFGDIYVLFAKCRGVQDVCSNLFAKCRGVQDVVECRMYTPISSWCCAMLLGCYAVLLRALVPGRELPSAFIEMSVCFVSSFFVHVEIPPAVNL
jgi:hypothetical protein